MLRFQSLSPNAGQWFALERPCPGAVSASPAKSWSLGGTQLWLFGTRGFRDRPLRTRQSPQIVRPGQIRFHPLRYSRTQWCAKLSLVILRWPALPTRCARRQGRVRARRRCAARHPRSMPALLRQQPIRPILWGELHVFCDCPPGSNLEDVPEIRLEPTEHGAFLSLGLLPGGGTNRVVSAPGFAKL